MAGGRSDCRSFTQCRAAARAVRAAEHGRQAIGTARPRSVFGLFRERAPLSLMIYVADREGRLVWRGADGFAVLEPPTARSVAIAGGGPWLSTLRIVDRKWDLVLCLGLPVSALLAMAGLVPLLPRPGALIALTLLVLVVSLYAVAVMQIVPLLRALAWIFPRMSGRLSGEQIDADILPQQQWSMPLCHAVDRRVADDLVGAALSQLRRLVAARVETVAAGLGGRPRSVDVSETMVCLRDGATTTVMRAALHARHGLTDTDEKKNKVVILVPTVRVRQPPRKVTESASFVGWYLAALGVYLVVAAAVVPDMEREGCAPNCAGRPVSYLDALHWLTYRMFLVSDPAGLSAETGFGRLTGLTTSIAGLAILPFLCSGLVRYRRSVRARREHFNTEVAKVHARSKLLILVVTPAEREAVIDAVRAVTGTPFSRQFLSQNTIHMLGQISETEILLGQSEQGTVAPSAATLTTSRLIHEITPDYVIMVGIGFSLRDEHELGDVMVSTEIRVMDHKKVIDSAAIDGAVAAIPRGHRVPPSTLLLDRCRSAHIDWPGQAVHFGPLLSSNVLVNSEALRQNLIDTEPDAIGGEMEGAGVFAAADREKIDWIVIKAVSDRGMQKTDAAHDLAARNAAQFVVHMVRTGALDRVPDSR